MQSDFGATLHNARVREGLDVNTVARRLRIRPDIIQAIENSDFERMPPRGYARNMVNSYARLLGLDASEITRQYLDEQYAYQVSLARGSARPSASRPVSAASSQAGRSARSGTRASRGASGSSRSSYGSSNRFGRQSYDDSVEIQPDYATPRARGSKASGANRSHRDTRHRSSGSVLNDEFLNAYAGPSKGRTWTANSSWRDRLPQIAIIVIAVVLLIVLLVLVFGPKQSEDEEVTNMPVTSVEDSSSASDEPTQVEEPTSFEFAYEVADGSSVWIEVYVDGDTKVAETVEGPASESYTVTKKVEFVAGNTDGVTVTQDGEEVELTTTDSGGVDLTLTFKKYLKQWQEENGTADSSDSSDSSSSSSNDTSS